MFVPVLPMDFPCNYDWVKHVLAKMEILIEQTEHYAIRGFARNAN